MRLLFDIGNSRTKWGVASDAGFKFLDSTATGSLSEVQLTQIAQTQSGVTSVWVSSVASEKVNQLIRNAFSPRTVRFVQVARQFAGIRNGYEDLSALGVDRWFSVIGARQHKSQGHVIVIDAGTSITIDCLDKQDVFLGGAILPGVKPMHESLLNSTAKINSELTEAKTVIGRTTQECVSAGVWYGLAAAIEGITNQIIAQLSQQNTCPVDVSILLCGGYAQALKPYLTLSVTIVPHLVFSGLAAVSEAGM